MIRFVKRLKVTVVLNVILELVDLNKTDPWTDLANIPSKIMFLPNFLIIVELHVPSLQRKLTYPDVT